MTSGSWTMMLVVTVNVILHTRPRVEGRRPVLFQPSRSAIWIENRIGVGYTLNYGNPRAWLLIAMMLAPVIAAGLLF
jgi:Family of unknown function (DUF5808)